MINFLLHNLSHMWPIILCGLAAIAIILERSRALYLVYPLAGAKNFFETIRNLVLKNRIEEAVIACDRHPSKLLAMLVKQGLIRAHQTEELVEHGLEITVGEMLDRVKARTGYLSMIANVSTLLGLIGTILGLIQSFEAVGSASAQERSALLAQGISVAMNHTLWGLAVAVPCMVLYSLLMNKTNRLKAELDRGVVRTLDILKQAQLISSDERSAQEAPGRSGHRSQRAS